MLFILSSFACFSKKKILKIKHPNVVSDKLVLGNGLVLSPADGDAGVEGGEEGPVWLHDHQLSALKDPASLPPVLTFCPPNPPPPHLWNLFIQSHLTTRHFIFFPL